MKINIVKKSLNSINSLVHRQKNDKNKTKGAPSLEISFKWIKNKLLDPKETNLEL